MSSKLKQIPERLLAKLWKERATREESFRAGDGRRFRVIYPGRTGTTAGPPVRFMPHIRRKGGHAARRATRISLTKPGDSA